MSSRIEGRNARKQICGRKRERYTESINGYIEKLLKGKQTVMVYNAIDGEVEIGIKNKRLIFPRVEGDSIVPVEPKGFSLGAYGISEPLGEKFNGKIDAVIVPMCAYSDSLDREGFGKGYYDRFLQNTDAVKIGAAFSCQKSESISVKATDIKMDYIVTENGILGEVKNENA